MQIQRLTKESVRYHDRNNETLQIGMKRHLDVEKFERFHLEKGTYISLTRHIYTSIDKPAVSNAASTHYMVRGNDGKEMMPMRCDEMRYDTMHFDLIRVIEVYKSSHGVALRLDVILPDLALKATLDSWSTCQHQ
jgi:hypothetical protein